MAYDEQLAERIRVLLSGEDGLGEKAMFGGLAFLVNGNMAIAASGQGGLLVRVAPEREDEALARPHAELAVMRGRPMTGWLRVAREGAEDDLDSWVRTGVEAARALPPKR